MVSSEPASSAWAWSPPSSHASARRSCPRPSDDIQPAERPSVPVTEANPSEPRAEHASTAGTTGRRRRVRALQIRVRVAAVIVGVRVIYLIPDTLRAVLLRTLLAL